MSLREQIGVLERQAADPHRGLPDELFYFVSRITPLINVDLLVKNDRGETLLTWRADNFGPPGWHVPGGIIRYKETMAERIKAVATGELGVAVEPEPWPLAVNEIILGRKNRGHFISLLFRCIMDGEPDEKRRCTDPVAPRPGQWFWHASCPANIIPIHGQMYRSLI